MSLISSWFIIQPFKWINSYEDYTTKPYKHTFLPKLDISNLTRRLLSMPNRLLSMPNHLNQHFGIKFTYINEPILLLESLHIKSQGQMLPNPGTTNCTNSQCSTICPAWGKQCLNCNKQNNFVKRCHQTTQSQGSMNALIANLWYDNTSDTCTTMNNDNITEIPALISLNEWHRSPITLSIFPDSSASLCLAGLKLLQALGFTKENLIHCNKLVTAVEGSKICLGWLPITFKIHDNTTTQPVYICDKVGKIYFSRKGCLEINILPALFPFPIQLKRK